MTNSHFDAVFAPGSADIICKYGLSLDFYAQAKPWLDAQEGRRLFWIENCPQRFAQYNEQLLQDSRVQIFYVETLLDQELAMQKIAWLSVYKKLEILDPAWKLRLETKYLAAQLLAADAADFGLSVARHARANFRKPMRRFSDVRGRMKGVPAVVIGAGPSLEKNGHLLEAWQDKALLITAGSAIHSVKTRPSLAVMLDPHQSIGKIPYAGVPFCIQGRTHPKTRTCTSGGVLYFADSHFAFEPWLSEGELLNTGWTVGNGAVAVALELGCNPIILVGMDYCYLAGQKYAWKQGGGDRPLVTSVNALGEKVETQSDWLMAVHWMEEISAAHPEVTFINATAGGMKIEGLFQTGELLTPPENPGVNAKWQQVIQQAPVIKLSKDRMESWMKSLAACRWNLLEEEWNPPLIGDMARELLLEPLWNIWGSVFERELMTDTQPIPLSDKLALQKRLFFNRVIAEHLQVYNG